MVSGTKTLATHTLNPVSYEVDPPWIGFDALSVWNLEAKSSHCNV